jgi:hypothetical protein
MEGKKPEGKTRITKFTIIFRAPPKNYSGGPSLSNSFSNFHAYIFGEKFNEFCQNCQGQTAGGVSLESTFFTIQAKNNKSPSIAPFVGAKAAQGLFTID